MLRKVWLLGGVKLDPDGEVAVGAGATAVPRMSVVPLVSSAEATSSDAATSDRPPMEPAAGPVTWSASTTSLPKLRVLLTPPTIPR